MKYCGIIANRFLKTEVNKLHLTLQDIPKYTAIMKKIDRECNKEQSQIYIFV